MRRIFLSYRRSDSPDVSGRIFDQLGAFFGTDNIFKDVDSIPYGLDFRKVVQNAVGICNVLLAIIGKDWISATDETGKRRIDDIEDYVNIEIATALNRQIPVIPVLVEETIMPSEKELPDNLKPLAFLNAAKVRPDPDFHNDIKRLCEEIKKHGVKSKRDTFRSSRWWFLSAVFAAVIVFSIAAVYGIYMIRDSDLYQTKKELGSLYFLGIGINDYKYANLKYAHTDIINLSQALINNNLGRSINSVFLINSEATRDRIISEIGHLREKLSYNDVGIIAFSGMESFDEKKNLILLSHDMIDIKRGLSAKDIFDVLPNARGHILFLLDTCHSGGMGEAISKVNPSIVTLASSGENQYCYESKKLKSGIFTAAVISGLNGKADANKDGLVDLFELSRYVEKEAARLAENEGFYQTPQTIGDVIQLHDVIISGAGRRR